MLRENVEMFQTYLRQTSIPMAWLCLFEIESVHQHRQFFGTHRDAVFLLTSYRPVKSAFLQAFGAYPQTAPIPHQGFQSGVGSNEILHTDSVVLWLSTVGIRCMGRRCGCIDAPYTAEFQSST